MCRDATNRSATARDGRRWRRWLWCAVCFWAWTITSVPGWAEETTVRVRLAWGHGADVMQHWSGQISIDGATLTDSDTAGADAVVTAHTHKPVNAHVAGVLQLNPGECGGWLTTA